MTTTPVRGVSPFVPASFTPEPYPVWVADPDMPGMAMPVTDLAELERLKAMGVATYGSPAGCVLYAGVQATAFDNPIRSEPVWNGQAFMDNGWTNRGLAPCGVRATYKIVATAGDTEPRIPAQWPPEAGATLPPATQRTRRAA